MKLFPLKHKGSETPDQSVRFRRGYDQRLMDGLVSLHEQAHGNESIRYCMTDPCRSLRVDHHGPASHNPGMF